MAPRYKLCWHGKFVYKFILEWPPGSVNVLNHEEGIITTVVEAVSKGDYPRKLSNGEYIADIEPREWKMSGQMVLEKDGAKYELYHHEFHLRVRRNSVAQHSAGGIRDRNTDEGSSTSGTSLPPVKQKWPSHKEKRKIRLPAVYRHRNCSASRAVVHRGSSRDLERALPLSVQDCLRYVTPKDSRHKLAVKQYYIPDMIYRALQQYANTSDTQNGNNAIIFLDDSVSLRESGPKAIQFGQSNDPTASTGLFQSLRRGIATVLDKMSKWMA
ncbi:uncharacterized protein [Dermacentor andersoni]|uniref:uncharacterized protein n=1 Tax=Dermacentor andersoni TaxID=34620 RepID=UPI0021555A3F|nr:uncharacterized protein LOC126533126 [Dermacentor andersoni]